MSADPNTTSPAGDWERLPRLPEPTGGFCCGTAGGRIIVAGGTNWHGATKRWLRAVQVFDPGTLRWSLSPPLPEAAAHGVAGDLPHGFMVVGGTDGSRPLSRSFRFEGGALAAVAGIGPAASTIFSAGSVAGEEFLIAGGNDNAASFTGLRNEAFAWNIRTAQARPLPPVPGPPFGLAAAVAIAGEWLIFGGAAWDAGTTANLARAQAYSLSSGRWRTLRPLPRAVRALSAVALDDRRILLAGGCAESFTDEAVIYDHREDCYAPAPPLPYAAYAGLVKCGAFVYCLGGEDRPMHRTDAAHRIAVAMLLGARASRRRE